MKHVYYYVFTCNSEDVEECINPLIPAFELYGDIKNIVIKDVENDERHKGFIFVLETDRKTANRLGKIIKATKVENVFVH